MCRRLVDAGAFVSPVLTAGATRFVGELTFSALASEPVRTSLWGNPEPIPHTRLGQSADLVVVAPATARLIAAYAAGLSSDLLTATLLATRAPVVVCPAMHTEMWEHPAVVDNIATLRRRGVHIVDPESGRLAGGDLGAGRLADPASIVAAAARVLSGAEEVVEALPSPLAGVGAVVSAGGTREPIDPVRYVGNRSSGKQGYAVASELAGRGARVVLVSTVTATLPDPAGVTVVAVETAAEMESAVLSAAAGAQVVVMAAAVADFRPKASADSKLKKSDGSPGGGARTDHRYPGRARRTAGSGTGSRRFRRGDPARTEPERVEGASEDIRPGEAGVQGRGPGGCQRCGGTRGRFRPRHQRSPHRLFRRRGDRCTAQFEQAVAAAVADAIESRLAPGADSVSERRGEVRSAEHSQEKA